MSVVSRHTARAVLSFLIRSGGEGDAESALIMFLGRLCGSFFQAPDAS